MDPCWATSYAYSPLRGIKYSYSLWVYSVDQSSMAGIYALPFTRFSAVADTLSAHFWGGESEKHLPT